MPTPIELLAARMKTTKGRAGVNNLFHKNVAIAKAALADVLHDLCDPTVCSGLSRDFWFTPVGNVLRESAWRSSTDDRLTLAEAAAILYPDRERPNTRIVALYHAVQRGDLTAWYKPESAFEGTEYGLRVKRPENKFDAPRLRYVRRSDVLRYLEALENRAEAKEAGIE